VILGIVWGYQRDILGITKIGFQWCRIGTIPWGYDGNIIGEI